jgi:MFS family permease
LFKFLLLANLLQYLEAGAVPAQLLQLSSAFHMGHGQQGLLGGVVYIALSCGGPFAGYFLRRFEKHHRRVVGVSLFINNVFTLMWALTPIDQRFSKLLFIALRFAMGLTQCIMCVYLPLWINEYAPSSRRTSWMSYLQVRPSACF